MKTVKIMIERFNHNSGSMWHYGHFIHDFIIPMIYYMNHNEVEWKHIYLDYVIY